MSTLPFGRSPSGTWCPGCQPRGWSSSAVLRAGEQRTPPQPWGAPFCRGRPSSPPWPAYLPMGAQSPPSLGVGAAETTEPRTPRTRPGLLAPWQTRSQADRAHPRKASRQRWDLVEHKTGPWSQAEKQDHRPLCCPPAHLPLATAPNAAAPSLGTARHHLQDHVGPALPWQSPQAYLEDRPGGRHWLLRICIKKTCSVFLRATCLRGRAAARVLHGSLCSWDPRETPQEPDP